jgi:hypothetical protein
MVERLTKLIYAEKSWFARGLRQYISETGCDNVLTVDEFTSQYGVRRGVEGGGALDFILPELERCADIIPMIKWRDPKESSGWARHAVTLVGVDTVSKELIVANPWGGRDEVAHVSPDEAKRRLDARASGGLSRYRYSEPDSGDIRVEFEGHDASVYGYLRVRQRDQSVRIESTGETMFPPTSGAPLRTMYVYTVDSADMPRINGFAVCLTGLEPEAIGRIAGPAGWTVQLWFKDNEARFAFPAPDMPSQSSERSHFTGIIWRANGSTPTSQRKREMLFSFESQTPDSWALKRIGRLLEDLPKMPPTRYRHLVELLETLRRTESTRDHDGDGIVLEETPEWTHATYAKVRVPASAEDLPSIGE